MIRAFFLAFLALAIAAGDASAQRSGYGKPERRDPIFLRFPEMAQRYWGNTASHRVVAIPLPRQCSFVYADSYTHGQMSEAELQEVAVSACNRKLAELGSLGENYTVACRCQVVITDDTYVVPRDMMPDQAYGPASIFYRDSQGKIARLNGLARYGALIGHDRSVTFNVDNVNGQPGCEGTFTNESVGAGRFSLSCFNGKFGGRGNFDSRVGAPNDHIVARGQTASGQPIVMVIGLPAQLAARLYGSI